MVWSFFFDGRRAENLSVQCINETRTSPGHSIWRAQIQVAPLMRHFMRSRRLTTGNGPHVSRDRPPASRHTLAAAISTAKPRLASRPAVDMLLDGGQDRREHKERQATISGTGATQCACGSTLAQSSRQGTALRPVSFNHGNGDRREKSREAEKSREERERQPR